MQRPYGVRLSRESIDCAYWLAPGSSLVEVRGGIDELQAEEMLDLRGDDNAYDEGIEFFATFRAETVKWSDMSRGKWMVESSENGARRILFVGCSPSHQIFHFLDVDRPIIGSGQGTFLPESMKADFRS